MGEIVVQGAQPGATEDTPEVGAARERRRSGPAPRSLAERLWEKVEKAPGAGCWIFTGSLQGGYGSISAGGHSGRMLRAHRVAWELIVGPVPDGLFVCHRCDEPACCRADKNPTKSHLFLGTQSDNMVDCAAKGRLSPVRLSSKNRGEANGRAKLTAALAAEVRASPLTAARAAEAFGVSVSTIHAIRQGRIWRGAA